MPQGFEQFAAFLPIIILFVLFYFLLIRPQQKSQRTRQEMLRNLKKGDRVVTVGGMHGLIKEVHEDFLILRVTDNVNLKFNRQGIDHVVQE